MASKREMVQLLSTKEAASVLRVSIRWLRSNQKCANRIPFIRIARKIYYDEKDLVNWLKQQKVKGTD